MKPLDMGDKNNQYTLNINSGMNIHHVDIREKQYDIIFVVFRAFPHNSYKKLLEKAELPSRGVTFSYLIIYYMI